MIFLLFDIEVAFLYPWAMALRDLGWPGFVQVVLFMLLAARRLRLRVAQGRARLGTRGSRGQSAGREGKSAIDHGTSKLKSRS